VDAGAGLLRGDVVPVVLARLCANPQLPAAHWQQLQAGIVERVQSRIAAAAAQQAQQREPEQQGHQQQQDQQCQQEPDQEAGAVSVTSPVLTKGQYEVLSHDRLVALCMMKDAEIASLRQGWKNTRRALVRATKASSETALVPAGQTADADFAVSYHGRKESHLTVRGGLALAVHFVVGML
jgi:hypothetical protein